jgi:hypothetical protein
MLCSGLLKLFGYKLTRGGHLQLKYNNLFSPLPKSHPISCNLLPSLISMFVFKTKRFSPVIVSSLLILIISSQSVISWQLEVIGTALGTSRFILSPLITVPLKSLAQAWLLLRILHSSIFKISFQIGFVSSFDGNLNKSI